MCAARSTMGPRERAELARPRMTPRLWLSSNSGLQKNWLAAGVLVLPPVMVAEMDWYAVTVHRQTLVPNLLRFRALFLGSLAFISFVVASSYRRFEFGVRYVGSAIGDGTNRRRDCRTRSRILLPTMQGHRDIEEGPQSYRPFCAQAANRLFMGKWRNARAFRGQDACGCRIEWTRIESPSRIRVEYPARRPSRRRNGMVAEGTANRLRTSTYAN